MTNIGPINSYQEALFQYKILDYNKDGKVTRDEIPTDLTVTDTNKNEEIEFLEFLELSKSAGSVFKFNPQEAFKLRDKLKSSPYNWNDKRTDKLIQEAIISLGRRWWYQSQVFELLPSIIQESIVASGNRWWYQGQVFEVIPSFIKAGITDPQEINELIQTAINSAGNNWVYSWDSLKNLSGGASIKKNKFEPIKKTVKERLLEEVKRGEYVLFKNPYDLGFLPYRAKDVDKRGLRFDFRQFKKTYGNIYKYLEKPETIQQFIIALNKLIKIPHLVHLINDKINIPKKHYQKTNYQTIINNKKKLAQILPHTLGMSPDLEIFHKVANRSMNCSEIKRTLETIKSIKLKRFYKENQLEIVRNRINNRKDERPLAVVIFPIPEADWNGSSDCKKGTFKSLIDHKYRVMYYEVSTDKAFYSALKSATNDQKAEVLILVGHGTSTSIQFGIDNGDKRHELDLSDREEMVKEKVGERLERGGRVIINSCSTGQGKEKKNNIANLLRDILPQAEKIIAPQVPVPFFELVFNGDKLVDADYLNDKYIARASLSWCLRGAQEYKNGKFNDSIKCFNKAIEINPKLSSLYFFRAMANFRLGRNKESREDFDKAIKLNPWDPLFYYCRSILRSNLMDKAGAEQDKKKADEIRIKKGIKIEFKTLPPLDPNLITNKFEFDLKYLTPEIRVGFKTYSNERAYFRVNGIKLTSHTKIVAKSVSAKDNLVVSDEQVEDEGLFSVKLEGLKHGITLPLLIRIDNIQLKVPVRIGE